MENDLNQMQEIIDKWGNVIVEDISEQDDAEYSIVEQYTIGNQTVTKWSNGDMEIIHKWIVGSTAVTTANGSNFISAGQVLTDYIESFTASNRDDIEVQGTANGDAAFGVWLIKAQNETTRPGTCFFASSTSITLTRGSMNIKSKGKWK